MKYFVFCKKILDFCLKGGGKIYLVLTILYKETYHEKAQRFEDASFFNRGHNSS